MNDNIYTPSTIARSLFRGRKQAPTYIADFAAGEGELLMAARRRWPAALITATDISRTSLDFLRRQFSGDWSIGRCDFLKRASRERCLPLKGMLGRMDLILLNPPFSCRGAATCAASAFGQTYACSRALAFVLEALAYLAPKGELIAIVPVSVCSSEKDGRALTSLKRHMFVRCGRSYGRGAFLGASAKTVVLRIKARRRSQSAFSIETPAGSISAMTDSLKIVRGTLQVHAILPNKLKKGFPVVHTTELQSQRVHINGTYVERHTRILSGPAILMPRVGKPMVSKIAILSAAQRVVLTDCILGIQCKSDAETKKLHSMLISSWEILRSHYSGTCAPYLTQAKLRSALLALGLSVGIMSHDNLR